MMWYKVTANFWADVDGDRKRVKEEYAIYAVMYGDAQATALKIIEDRIKENDLDISKMRGLTDVYIKASSEDWTNFYIVTVLVDGIDKKRTEKHLLNASSTGNANDRVKATYKASKAAYVIKKVEETKILGIYDSLRSDLVDDFRNRQDYLADTGFREANRNEGTIFNADGSAKQPANNDEPQSDPNAVTAIVVRGIVEADVEDMNNGYDGQAEHLEHVRELTSGSVAALPEGKEEPETAEVE